MIKPTSLQFIIFWSALFFMIESCKVSHDLDYDKFDSYIDDRDGDGIADLDDNCPNIAGLKSNSGCPFFTEKIQEEINQHAKKILFHDNAAEFKDEPPLSLMSITNILYRFPNSTFVIEGHYNLALDKNKNQELTEMRVNAVKDYLVSNKSIKSQITINVIDHNGFNYQNIEINHIN